MKKASGQHIEF